ncbi:hypothetical protein HDU97_010439 [Phlyctochytrium planicorne]|nr:hypothetical protein HDU97_010439 [Phlyctochytrium planicorne]
MLARAFTDLLTGSAFKFDGIDMADIFFLPEGFGGRQTPQTSKDPTPAAETADFVYVTGIEEFFESETTGAVHEFVAAVEPEIPAPPSSDADLLATTTLKEPAPVAEPAEFLFVTGIKELYEIETKATTAVSEAARTATPTAEVATETVFITVIEEILEPETNVAVIEIAAEEVTPIAEVATEMVYITVVEEIHEPENNVAITEIASEEVVPITEVTTTTVFITVIEEILEPETNVAVCEAATEEATEVVHITEILKPETTTAVPEAVAAVEPKIQELSTPADDLSAILTSEPIAEDATDVVFIAVVEELIEPEMTVMVSQPALPMRFYSHSFTITKREVGDLVCLTLTEELWDMAADPTEMPMTFTTEVTFKSDVAAEKEDGFAHANIVEEVLEAEVATAAEPTVENEIAVIERLDAVTPVFIENHVIESGAELVHGSDIIPTATQVPTSVSTLVPAPVPAPAYFKALSVKPNGCGDLFHRKVSIEDGFHEKALEAIKKNASVIAMIDGDKSAAPMASSTKGTASKTASPIPILMAEPPPHPTSTTTGARHHLQLPPRPSLAVAVPIQHQLPPRPSPAVAVPRQQQQLHGPPPGTRNFNSLTNSWEPALPEAKKTNSKRQNRRSRSTANFHNSLAPRTTSTSLTCR